MQNLLKKNGIFLSTNGSAMEDIRDSIFLTELIDAGKIKPVIDRCYPLDRLSRHTGTLNQSTRKEML